MVECQPNRMAFGVVSSNAIAVEVQEPDLDEGFTLGCCIKVSGHIAFHCSLETGACGQKCFATSLVCFSVKVNGLLYTCHLSTFLSNIAILLPMTQLSIMLHTLQKINHMQQGAFIWLNDKY